MAAGAHAVPVLAVARPVQPVGRRDLPAGVEEEPALAGDVPRERERLHPAARELDEVLLERIPAERVSRLVDRGLAVRPGRLDEELLPVAEEPRLHPVALEDDAREVAAHRRVGRLGHREVVVRARPGLRRLLVALGARLAAHERRLGGRRTLRRGPPHARRGRARADTRRRRGQRPRRPPASTGRARPSPRHALVTCAASNADRRMGAETSTLTMPFSMRTAKRSSGTRCGRREDVAAEVEHGGMARAREAPGGLVPRDAAPEVRALAVEREEPAVGEAHEVELPRRERRHRAGREPVRRAGDDEAAGVLRRLRPRLQERHDDPRGLGEGRDPEREPRELQERSPLRTFRRPARAASRVPRPHQLHARSPEPDSDDRQDGEGRPEEDEERLRRLEARRAEPRPQEPEARERLRRGERRPAGRRAGRTQPPPTALRTCREAVRPRGREAASRRARPAAASFAVRRPFSERNHAPRGSSSEKPRYGSAQSASDAEQRNDDDREERMEMDEELLEAEEVPRRLRGVEREAGVGRGAERRPHERGKERHRGEHDESRRELAPQELRQEEDLSRACRSRRAPRRAAGRRRRPSARARSGTPRPRRAARAATACGARSTSRASPARSPLRRAGTRRARARRSGRMPPSRSRS